MSDEPTAEHALTNEDLACAARKTAYQLLKAMHTLASGDLYDHEIPEAMPALAAGVGVTLDTLATLKRLDGPQSITINPGAQALPGIVKGQVIAKPQGF